MLINKRKWGRSGLYCSLILAMLEATRPMINPSSAPTTAAGTPISNTANQTVAGRTSMPLISPGRVDALEKQK